MGHTSHREIWDMGNLGIVQGLPNRIPRLTLYYPISLIAKATQLIFHPTFSTDDFPIGTRTQSGFTLFIVTSI